MQGEHSMLSDTQNMREFGREIEIIDGKELIYEHHYAPIETVVYEQAAPVERERIFYEPNPSVEHLVKTKVIDITKSASYGEYATHKAGIETSEKSEFDKIQDESKISVEVTRSTQSVREKVICNMKAQIEAFTFLTHDYDAIAEQLRALEERKEAYDQSIEIEKAYYEQELDVQENEL